MMNKNEIIADNEYDWNIKPTKENVRLTFNLILNLIFQTSSTITTTVDSSKQVDFSNNSNTQNATLTVDLNNEEIIK